MKYLLGRRLGTFGLLLVVLGAFMALAVGTASATRLCTTEGVKEKCTSGFYVAGTTVEAQLTTATNWAMQETFAKLECSSSTMKGKLTSEGGGLGWPVALSLETFTWGGLCTCTKMAVANPLPWSAQFRGTGNRDGEFFVPLSLQTECNKEVCLYNATVAAAIKGGAPATLAFNNNMTPVAGSGPNCGNPTNVIATYTFQAPTAFYITKE